MEDEEKKNPPEGEKRTAKPRAPRLPPSDVAVNPDVDYELRGRT